MINKKTLTLLLLVAAAAAVAAFWDKIGPLLGITPKQPASGADLVTGDSTGTTSTGGGGSTGSTSSSGGTGQSQLTAMQRYEKLSGTPSASRILKKGVSGSKSVFILQALLNYGWKKNLVLDGAFGSNTETALYSVFNKRTTTLNEFVTQKVPKTSPAYSLLAQYGLGLPVSTSSINTTSTTSNSSEETVFEQAQNFWKNLFN